MISVTFGSDLMCLKYTVSNLGVIFFGTPCILLPHGLFLIFTCTSLYEYTEKEHYKFERKNGEK